MLSYKTQPREFLTSKTSLLGEGDTKRELHTRIASSYRDIRIYVKQADPDERTGRLLIAADYSDDFEEEGDQPFTRQVYLADFPE